MQKYYTNIWWWWIGLTLLYLLGFRTGGLDGGAMGHILGFVGLFVPVGFLTGLFLISASGIILIPIIIAIFIGEQYFVKKSYLKDCQKMLLALLTLLLVTMLVDFAFLHYWASWNIFVSGQFPHF